jgi:hypothetical protein
MRAPEDVPVLLIIFNRPDKTRRMVSRLREVRPRRLFVAADGPRHGTPSDTAACLAARSVLDEIDWDCDVRTFFQDSNLGCKRGPETAIGWFMSQVPDGIILEDDCLPSADFFPYCAELLERYAADEDVMMISGLNELGAAPDARSSYLFSPTTPTWGWATWRRAWQHYDPAMSDWPSPAARRAVRARMTAAEFRLTRRLFDRVHAGTLDAWDFAWSFAVHRRGGLSVVPARNMISNIGFGQDATHTKNVWSAEARIPVYPLSFPLVHPASVAPSETFEAALLRRRFPPARRVMTLLPPALSDRVRAAVYGLAHRRVRRPDARGPRGGPSTARGGAPSEPGQGR